MTREIRNERYKHLQNALALRELSKVESNYKKNREIQKLQDEEYKKFEFYKNIIKAKEKIENEKIN